MFAKFASHSVHDEELGWLDACKDFVEAADNECGFQVETELKGYWFDTVIDIQMSMMAQWNTSTEVDFSKCCETLYECIGSWETILR
jgi:hypothetical protein